jgi:GDP-mannose 6-dehydrogenase
MSLTDTFPAEKVAAHSGRHRISIFGLGYVGCVTAACLSAQGSYVLGVDVNSSKVEMLNAGHSTIIEAQIDGLVAEAHQSCRLHATSDAVEAVLATDVSFVCVGTPSQHNGKLDLSHVESVCREIGKGLAHKRSFHWVVIRSTVLPGSTRSVAIPALESSSGKRAGKDFGVCYNPEFMREGTAVADFNSPPYTVLGAQDPKHLRLLREIYDRIPGNVYETSLEVAEMVKYLSNAFHALKVAFANEIGTLAKHLGVDAQLATQIFTSDTRLNISPAYLSPGFAFGGSCLPKDVRALNYKARELDLHLPLLEAVLPSNQQHIARATDAILRTKRRKIGVLGLSFKAGTDDLRESPHVELVKRLIGEGCEVHVWDQCVSLGQIAGSNRNFIEEMIPHIGQLLTTSMESVIESSEVVVLASQAVDRRELARLLNASQIVIDLVNLDKSRRPQPTAFYEGICW